MSTSNHPRNGRGDQEKHGQMAEEIKKTEKNHYCPLLGLAFGSLTRKNNAAHFLPLAGGEN